jgi:hypothetical protein
MMHSKAFIGSLVLSTMFVVSVCAVEASYIAPADGYAHNSYLVYPYECNYGFGYGCPPYAYHPPAVFGFDHFGRFHDYSGAFPGHGYAGHGGFGLGRYGGGRHR